MTFAAMKLWETTDALDVVRAWVYENDEAIRAMEGALPDELAELLEQAEGDFRSKAEQVALFIRELLSSAAAVKIEEERLAGRRRHYERSAESLKTYLKLNMERADVPKVEGKLVSVRLQKNPPAVKAMLDQESLAKMRDDIETALFVTTVPESYRVDTDYAKAVWKNGGELPSGISVEQGRHIRIA